ncbi:MAG: SDR family NAD(P)-dependent oxidoreductase [Candidatus Lokiarchaeota archaeon]|nr:SDR family NAD(P)-dependent oxidoreductase [Candidatus Lokiarchaeota archaeon]
MKDFKDKVAVVTGAASGIGFGIAKRAVKEGMKVVIADIEAEALSQADKKLTSIGGNVLSVVTDVSKLEEVKSLADKTIDRFGEVHLLFNNAGVAKRDVLWDFTLADWKWIINVNLWGVIHGIVNFLPILRRQDFESRIINTASIAGLTTYTLNGIYGPIKHAIVAISETLNHELRVVNSKINVSVLCPGAVLTNLGISARNRPEELKNLEPEILDRQSRVMKFLTDYPEFKSTITQFGQGATKRGISGEKVGDIVFEAIKDDSFYILTDTGEWLEALVKNRMNNILDSFEQNRKYNI